MISQLNDTTSDVIPCAVIMDKQNAIVYLQMAFKQFEHSQVYSADVQGNNIDQVSVPLRIAVDISDGMQWQGTELTCTCFLCKS